MVKEDTTFEDISIIPQVSRKVTSYWLDPLVSKMFKDKCHQLGLHTCNVLEPIMYAFVKGMSKTNYFQPIGDVKINLNVHRVVRREDKVFSTESRDVPLVEQGSFNECCVCGSLPVERACISEPHQESIRFLCEEHFYEHKDTYKNIPYSKQIRDYTYSYNRKSICGSWVRKYKKL